MGDSRLFLFLLLAALCDFFVVTLFAGLFLVVLLVALLVLFAVGFGVFLVRFFLGLFIFGFYGLQCFAFFATFLFFFVDFLSLTVSLRRRSRNWTIGVEDFQAHGPEPS